MSEEHPWCCARCGEPLGEEEHSCPRLWWPWWSDEEGVINQWQTGFEKGAAFIRRLKPEVKP
jgi:hypothetical protein